MDLATKIVLLHIFAFFSYIVTGDKNPYQLDLKRNNEYVDAYYQKCTGFCNEKFCKVNISCRPVNRTSKIRRTDIYFHDGVKLEAPIFFEISTFKKFATQYRPLMLKTKDDFCKTMLQKNENAVLKFFYIANVSGNLLDPCPISGHRFELPKYTTLWVGTLVPTGEWRIDFALSKVINRVEEHILTISYYFQVKAKSATEF